MSQICDRHLGSSSPFSFAHPLPPEKGAEFYKAGSAFARRNPLCRVPVDKTKWTTGWLLLLTFSQDRAAPSQGSKSTAHAGGKRQRRSKTYRQCAVDGSGDVSCCCKSTCVREHQELRPLMLPVQPKEGCRPFTLQEVPCRIPQGRFCLILLI